MNPEDYESLPTGTVLTHMSAGAIAGVMEHCIMYPLDSVKTRMQSLQAARGEGISETFLRMVRHEGLLRPVRGMSIMVLGAGPSHAVYFSSYEFFKTIMVPKVSNANLHSLVYGAAGGLSTILHDAIMNPAEVIKQRIQMANSPYKSVLDCMIKTYRKEGLHAFYRSYITQLTMNIPFQSIHFAVYEFCQKRTNKEGAYNPPAHVISGAAAGATAAALTTPLDVCKTLLNTQEGTKTSGLMQAINIVYRLGGVGGFFRGVQARIMYTMPSTAICWSTYEFFKYLLGATEMRIGAAVHAEDAAGVVVVGGGGEGGEKKDSTADLRSAKSPKELPVISGAGLYSSVSFNTMHTADNRRKDSVLNITHT